MVTPAPRQAALAAVAVAALAGLGLSVAGPLAPTDPPPRATTATASGLGTPGPTSVAPSASATPTTGLPSAPLPAARPPTGRLAGGDRYALSVAASRAAFPGSAHAPVVFLVSGRSQSLGYAALPAAAALGGSVLLTRPDGIPRVTAAELDRLDPAHIVLVGDTTSLGAGVARAAARHAGIVTRVDGSGPEGTSLAVTRRAFSVARRAWVVDRDSPEHAVVAASLAAGNRSPLLVVDGSARRLPAAHTRLLRDLGVTDVTVVGPVRAVSAGIADDLEQVVGAHHVRRASGADRYAVAAQVNALGRPDLPAGVAGVAYLADGRDPVTAFSGAVLAGLSGRPLHYALPYCVPASVRPALVSRDVSRVVSVGGESSLRSLAARLEPCRSTTDMASDWVLVNRRNPLSPKTFSPADLVVVPMSDAGGGRLRADAAAALGRMASAVADGAGRVGIDTAYRSYATQDALYDRWLARRGRTWTDTWYARPGYSEHQTGLTVDLLPVGAASCRINDCIDETPQGRWLAANAWRHGFILRYEKGYRPTVGIGFEPWHFRYVGTALAKAYHDGGWHTLEAFLDEPPAPSY
ncbi:MAG: D-alanyl-D-alanine carboxypeptidase family protein [Ornithinibacter sp.]